jgi:hypothetical protein
MTEQNALRQAELGRLQSMSAQLMQRNQRATQRNDQLRAQIADNLRKQAPQPESVTQEIEKLRRFIVMFQQQASKCAIDLRFLQEASSGPSKGEQRYEDERMVYRAKLKEMCLLIRSVEKLRKEQGALNVPFGAHKIPLSAITDVRLMLSEDRDVTFVQAAPLELLGELLFHPGNTDVAYVPGLLVLLHTEKIEIPEFVTAVTRAYEKTEFIDTRNARVQALVDKWRAWFPNDLTDSKKKSQMMPIFQLLGSAGIFDVGTRSHDDCQFDAHVPIDAKQTDIAWAATPHILAEHFSYFELQILRDIPAYEFMGCGWSAADKWQRAPRIMKMTDHFNTMSQMIVASIVTTETYDGRLRLLERWILIMDAALKINNYQLVFEIFGALCNPALTQLQRMWKALPLEIRKLYDEFRALTAPSARFETYRKRLAENPPETVVPYIGPMLTSLVYISDGNPSKKTIPDVTEIVWNFSKYRTYSQTMEDVMAPWGAELKFVLNQELFTRIRSIPPIDQSEAELFAKAQLLKE